jgi:hypothetical protein
MLTDPVIRPTRLQPILSIEIRIVNQISRNLAPIMQCVDPWVTTNQNAVIPLFSLQRLPGLLMNHGEAQPNFFSEGKVPPTPSR